MGARGCGGKPSTLEQPSASTGNLTTPDNTQESKLHRIAHGGSLGAGSMVTHRAPGRAAERGWHPMMRPRLHLRYVAASLLDSTAQEGRAVEPFLGAPVSRRRIGANRPERRLGFAVSDGGAVTMSESSTTDLCHLPRCALWRARRMRHNSCRTAAATVPHSTTARSATRELKGSRWSRGLLEKEQPSHRRPWEAPYARRSTEGFLAECLRAPGAG